MVFVDNNGGAEVRIDCGKVTVSIQRHVVGLIASEINFAYQPPDMHLHTLSAVVAYDEPPN